jgi:hypothetical protein
MGLLESAINGPFYHAGNTADTYAANPDQALLGVNTPGEAYLANSLGGNYTPTANMYGGPSEDVYAKAQRDGVDMTANRIADAAAPAIIGATGLGAPFAAALAAANSAGQGYELQRMKQQMRDNGMQYGTYARGGLASTAKHVQAHGRNRDSMLVHMSPREVKGLQQLAMATGGSLTINPHTGLPEAGWLEQLIPMIGGAALTMIPGVGPLAAAGIMAGGYGIATGSLEKGLMAGLSAYGGANLGAGLSELGSSALANAGGSAGEAAFTAAQPEALASAAGYEMPTGQLAAQNALTAQNFPNLSPDTLQTLQSQVPNAANPVDISRAAGMANATANVTPAQSMGEGFKQATSSGQNAMDFLGNNKMNLLSAVGPAAMSAFGEQGNVGGSMTPEEESKLKRISPNFRASVPNRPNPYYQAQYPTYAAQGGIMQAYQAGGPVERMTQANTAMNPQGGLYPQGMIDKTQYATPTQRPTSLEVVESEPSYEARTNPMTGTMMAAGGIARYAPGGYLPKDYQPLSHLPVKGVYSDNDPDTAKKPADQAAMIRFNKILAAANLPKSKMPKTSIKGLGDMPEVTAADGGMMRGLGGYSDGGRMLKGPGDGMSDSIPAVIGSKQPARLADGEFVVPADVVSHLGNGSTDAGAKKLYGMMDKIRKARTGTKKQGKKINPNKYLPA